VNRVVGSDPSHRLGDFSAGQGQPWQAEQAAENGGDQPENHKSPLLRESVCSNDHGGTSLARAHAPPVTSVDAEGLTLSGEDTSLPAGLSERARSGRARFIPGLTPRRGKVASPGIPRAVRSWHASHLQQDHHRVSRPLMVRGRTIRRMTMGACRRQRAGQIPMAQALCGFACEHRLAAMTSCP
jgi:hypothetical protein